MGHLKDSERIRLKGCTTKIRLGPTTMRIKTEIFCRTHFPRKVQINISNQENCIRKNSKNFRGNLGGNLGHEDSK
jgi:hypothetical protein